MAKNTYGMHISTIPSVGEKMLGHKFELYLDENDDLVVGDDLVGWQTSTVVGVEFHAFDKETLCASYWVETRNSKILAFISLKPTK